MREASIAALLSNRVRWSLAMGKSRARRRAHRPSPPAPLSARASKLLLHFASRTLCGVRQVSARLSSSRRPTRSRKDKATVAERLEASPERLPRPRESGQEIIEDRDRRVRIDDPFDAMPAHRALAPHDPRLNDL